MILDANLLIYAIDERSPAHGRAAAWLVNTLNGEVRVGLPWQTIGAFLRIVTHPRISERPLSAEQAWSHVASWLAVPVVWIPAATEATARVYAQLTHQVDITANLVPDAQLAALAIENGTQLASTDTDFARFPGLRWLNPIGT